jgi:hypothetical protein
MDQLKTVDPTLSGIAGALGQLQQSQEDLRRELLGNGQPGRIQKLEEDVKNLNKRYWIFTGAIVTATHGLKYFLSKFGII